jgi:hypothetical protein
MKARGVEDLPEKEAEQVQTIVRVLNCKNHYEVSFLRPLPIYQACRKLWRHITAKTRLNYPSYKSLATRVTYRDVKIITDDVKYGFAKLMSSYSLRMPHLTHESKTKNIQPETSGF